MREFEMIWHGFEYNSTEHCRISTSGNQILVRSKIIGDSLGKDFIVLYILELDRQWNTVRFSLQMYQKGTETQFSLESTGNLRWILNGEINENLNNCIDIDLPLTPFTNSLPINRLALNKGDEVIINVAYFDIMGDGISAKKQLYKRLDSYQYFYQNIPNDFEAIITTDPNGFVVDYPGLFTRMKT